MATPTDKIPEVKDKTETIKHVLVPDHRILKSEEKKELLGKYDIKLKQLPRVSIKDPIVKTLTDAKPGDVVEIIRSSVTAGKAVYYRVIIND
jgi:DNA-directed RNA polymerase subunit H